MGDTMIINKLSEILGRKKLKIVDVINETGVTRPTLTSLYYGNGKGISFDVLNKLCGYLSVTPGELFAYYDIDVVEIVIDFESIDAVSMKEYSPFTGRIAFAQSKYPSFTFEGHLDDDRHKHEYDLALYIDLPRDKYLHMFPDDVIEDHIENLLFERIINELSKYDDQAELGSVTFFYSDEK